MRERRLLWLLNASVWAALLWGCSTSRDGVDGKELAAIVRQDARPGPPVKCKPGEVVVNNAWCSTWKELTQ